MTLGKESRQTHCCFRAHCRYGQSTLRTLHVGGTAAGGSRRLGGISPVAVIIGGAMVAMFWCPQGVGANPVPVLGGAPAAPRRQELLAMSKAAWRLCRLTPLQPVDEVWSSSKVQARHLYDAIHFVGADFPWKPPLSRSRARPRPPRPAARPPPSDAQHHSDAPLLPPTRTPVRCCWRRKALWSHALRAGRLRSRCGPARHWCCH